MAYRGDDAADALEAPTAEGLLRVTLGPNRLDLTCAAQKLHLAERLATLVEQHGKKKPQRISVTLSGLALARGFPREDLGIWACAEVTDGKPAHAMRRLFGVSPESLMEDRGLYSLARLDAVAHRLRFALDDYATRAGIWSARGVEIGGGHPLDKVLFVDRGDRHEIFARKLFRDQARFIAAIHHDGRIVVPEGKVVHEASVTSKFGITVRGDYIRFADPHGTDLVRFELPWIGPEDRDELARRIGQLVDQA